METFFGVEIVPGETMEYIHPQAQLHLCQATLSLDAKAGQRVGVSVGVTKDGPHVLLCSLREGTCESLSLDLILNSYAEFKVVGNASVHLTGYYVLLAEHDQGGDEPNDVNQGHICSPAEDPDTALKKLAMGPPNSITSEKNIPQLPETETPGVDKAKIGSVGGGCQGEYHQEAKDSSVVECGGVEGKFAQLNLNPSGVMTTSASQSPKTPVAAPQPSEPARKFLMPQHSHLQGEALSPKDATYEVPRASKNEQRFLSPHPRERTAGAQTGQWPGALDGGNGAWANIGHDPHADDGDGQLMEIALEDISTIKSVLHSGTPIEALKGAQSLNKAYQLWMEKMRIKVGQPRPWEFQPDSKNYLEGMARFCENVDDYSHKEDFTRPGQSWHIPWPVDIPLSTLCGG